MKFEWNRDKDKTNLKKHGVSFEEASTVFGDPLSLTIGDSIHSDDEDRFLIIGLSSSLQLLVVSHTVRENCVRIVSARLATNKERNDYES
jgi:uncharacterized protein